MRVLIAARRSIRASSALRNAFTSALFIGAVIAGSGLGAGVPAVRALAGSAVDPLILLLVGLLFFELRGRGLPALRRAPTVVALAWGVNFVLVPIVAVILTSAFLADDAAVRTGVLIYCLFPCTDWFLGFTRMAGGNTAAGAALIPINMTTQLALYPLYLSLLTGEPVGSTFGDVGPALLRWFVLPAGAGLLLRLLVTRTLPRHRRTAILGWAGALIPYVIAALILCLFATNVETGLQRPMTFGRVLLVVFLFFVVVYLLGGAIARLARLPYRDRVLLTMTTSARNAPLMLAVTGFALPGQPLVYAAIILGMLIEFPHLTTVKHLLRRRAASGRDPLFTDNEYRYC